MKKLYLSCVLGLSAMFLLGGCVAAIGNRGNQHGGGTLGQQLIDLQKAKESGAMTEAEYQAEKAKLLRDK